jgi:hypothetical protein
MDPYYATRQTFGPVENGLNNKGQQLFGHSRSLGAVTGGSLSVGAVAGAGIIALYVVPTVVQVLISNKVLGFENRLSTKKMSGRAAALGAVMGAPLALIIGGGLAKQG